MTACNRVWTRALVEKDCASWPVDQRVRWLELFGDESSPRPWVRETAYQKAGVYTRYLSITGEDWLTPNGVRMFVRSVEKKVCPRTVAGYVAALFGIGRLLRPEANLHWLYRAAVRMIQLASRTPKKSTTVVPDAVDVLEHADRLIAAARRLGPNSARGRYLFRTGLFLHLAIHNPERLRALATIRCDQVHLDDSLITFEAHQIKNKRASQRRLTRELVLLLREWMVEYRAAAKPTHEFLWVTSSGAAPCTETLYAAVRAETRSMKVQLTPKLLRNAAATFIVTEAPDRAEIASTILGHRSERMREEYTETANMMQASREAVRILSDAGKRARAIASPGKRATRRNRGEAGSGQATGDAKRLRQLGNARG